MYFHSWICTYCAVTMAAGFGINGFQLSIKYICWMVGIVPLVSQTATAGGEAGVGVYVAVLGRGEGRCDIAELQWCEVLEIQQVSTPLRWTRGSQGSSTDFYSEDQNVRPPNTIMENNNSHSLACRTNRRATHQFSTPVWSHCGDESLVAVGEEGLNSSWMRCNSFLRSGQLILQHVFQRRWKWWRRRVYWGRPC